MLIGLDVGTTATKALLFEHDGRIVATATVPYGLITPHEGWVEQDPEALWRAACFALRTIAAQLPSGAAIEALAQSSQGGTTIPVDTQGQPVYNAISWMDGRAEAERAALAAEGAAGMIGRTTGWALTAGLPLQHLRWLHNHRRDVVEHMADVMFVNDFIGRRLTGLRCMNPSDAGITQLYNIETGDWDDTLLQWAGVRRDQLSPLRESGAVIGTLTRAAAIQCGLPAGLPVVNGAHDQYCAALGIGVSEPGEVLLSCGTAWVLLVVPPDLQTGRASGLALSRHAAPGRWGGIRSLGAMGAAVEWLAAHVWGGANDDTGRANVYAAINAAAAQAAPGAAGLLFFPPAGGHAGGYGMKRGGFLGLSLSHTRNELSRAVFEGVACELAWALEETAAAGVPLNRLKMVGGAARSPLLPRIIADVTRIPVAAPAITEAAAWGAAALAGIGAGVYADHTAAGRAASHMWTYYEPSDAAAHKQLNDYYRRLWRAVSA